MNKPYSHFSERHYEGIPSGPFRSLNPTIRRRPLNSRKQGSPKDDLKDDNNVEGKLEDGQPHETHAEDVQETWRSRDNRKGRHVLEIAPAIDKNTNYLTPRRTSTLNETLRGIGRMFTIYPYWDVSYLVAIVFTWGSVIWCVNAFFVWLPLQDPSTEFPNEIESAGGISAFVGATVFEFGSILLMLEAVNENRADCFGWAVEEALEERGVIKVTKGECVHHHNNKHNFVGKEKATEGKPPIDTHMRGKDQPNSKSARTWTWWPTWHELTSHYFREIGFLACLAQMFGATIFWISGFTALPPIYNRLTSTAALNGAYWAPQVIGGSGFIVSGILFMVETQKKWYIPAFNVLGWHIGLWNLVGGIGFTLCGALGFASTNSGAVYQGSLATFWGSWCFLIGSVIQWFESLNKQPVEIKQDSDKLADENLTN